MTNEKKVSSREVLIHFMKFLDDGGAEYTDNQYEANEVSVFTQVHYHNMDEFDIIDEEEFNILELGYTEAKRQAEEYASKLSEKYGVDYSWY